MFQGVRNGVKEVIVPVVHVSGDGELTSFDLPLEVVGLAEIVQEYARLVGLADNPIAVGDGVLQDKADQAVV